MPESSSYDTASSDKPRSCGGLEKTSTKLSIVVTCAPTTLPLSSCLFGKLVRRLACYHPSGGTVCYHRPLLPPTNHMTHCVSLVSVGDFVAGEDRRIGCTPAPRSQKAAAAAPHPCDDSHLKKSIIPERTRPAADNRGISELCQATGREKDTKDSPSGRRGTVMNVTYYRSRPKVPSRQRIRLADNRNHAC